MNTFKIRGGLGDSAVANTNVKPQDNLYLATNSQWLEKAKIPADRPLMDSFVELDTKIRKQLLKDFNNFAFNNKKLPDLDNLDKATTLYKLTLDFDKRNADSAQPIKPDLQKLLSLSRFSDFNQNLAQLIKDAFSLPLYFYVDADMRNTSQNSLYFASPNSFLPDASAYKDPSSEELLNTFEKQSAKLLTLAGLSSEDSKQIAANAVRFDKKLAKHKKSQEEINDFASMYNAYSTQQFASSFKFLDIEQLLNSIFSKVPEKIIVIEPNYLKHINELVNPENFEELKSWILVKFVNSSADYLSEEFQKAAFPYKQAVEGVRELPSTEKQAYRVANRVFAEVIGIYYAQSYFGSTAKVNVEQMINKMLETYKQRLQDNSWLSESTKNEALKKLDHITLKIGYPDKISDVYNDIQVSANKSLYENISAANKTWVQYSFNELYKPVDRTLWGPDAPANLINAFYDPTKNDITFPAAILQKPFYSSDNTLSENLGGIGAVIAHEITHAFDPNGAKFDEFGNIRNWWSEEDYNKFTELSQAEIELFDGIICGGLKTNGKLTVGENVADLGGLTVAVETAKKENGNLQELFQAWAKIWRGKMMPQFRKSIIAYDSHAPSELRSNVPAQCIDDFYQTFNIQPTDGMWLDPEKRVHIW